MKRTVAWVIIALIALFFASRLDKVLVYSETAMLPSNAESYKVKEIMSKYFKEMENNTLLFAIMNVNVTSERAWKWYWTWKNETGVNSTSFYDIWKEAQEGLKKLYSNSKKFEGMYNGINNGLANVWAATDVIHYIMVMNGLYSMSKKEAIETFQALVAGTPLQNMTSLAEELYDAVHKRGVDPATVDESFTLSVAYKSLLKSFKSQYAAAYLNCTYKNLVREVRRKQYWMQYPMDFQSIKNLAMKDIKKVEVKAISCFARWFAKKIGLPGDVVSEIMLAAHLNKHVDFKKLALELIMKKYGKILKTMFISKDWKATIIRIPINDYEEALRLKREALALGRGTLEKAYLLGSKVLNVELQKANVEDAERVQQLSHLLVLVVLFAITRSLVATFLPFIVVGIGIIVGMALAYFVGLVTPIYHLAKTLMVTTGLGLGMDYSIFILARFKEEAVRGLSPSDAARVSAKRAGHAVGMSALAASLGFASLALSGTLMLNSMGITIPLVVLATAAAAITLLPEVLSKVGEKKWFWWPGKLEVKEEKPFTFSPPLRMILPIFLIVLAITAYALVFYVNYKGTSNTMLFLPKGTEAYEALSAFAKKFPAGAWGPIYVLSIGCNYEPLVKKIEQMSGVSAIITPSDMPQLKKGDVSLIIVIPKFQPFSERTMKLVEKIREVRPRGCLVGGMPAELLDTKVLVSKAFWERVAPFAILATMAVLALSTRRASPVVSAAFSLVAAISWAVTLSHCLSEALWGVSLYWITPLIALIATLGIGTDYNVFYISRVIEELEKRAVNPVWSPLRSTAPVIIGLASIMASAYFGMLIARSVALKQMGLALGFSAMFAAINATLLNPILLTIIGAIIIALKKGRP